MWLGFFIVTSYFIDGSLAFFYEVKKNVLYKMFTMMDFRAHPKITNVKQVLICVICTVCLDEKLTLLCFEMSH